MIGSLALRSQSFRTWFPRGAAGTGIPKAHKSQGNPSQWSQVSLASILITSMHWDVYMVSSNVNKKNLTNLLFFIFMRPKACWAITIDLGLFYKTINQIIDIFFFIITNPQLPNWETLLLLLYIHTVDPSVLQIMFARMYALREQENKYDYSIVTWLMGKFR